MFIAVANSSSVRDDVLRIRLFYLGIQEHRLPVRLVTILGGLHAPVIVQQRLCPMFGYRRIDIGVDKPIKLFPSDTDMREVRISERVRQLLHRSPNRTQLVASGRPS